MVANKSGLQTARIPEQETCPRFFMVRHSLLLGGVFCNVAAHKLYE